MVSVYRSFRYASGRVAAGVPVQVVAEGTDTVLRDLVTDSLGAVEFEIAYGTYDYLALGVRVTFDVVEPEQGIQGPRGYRPTMSRAGDNVLVTYPDGEGDVDLGSFKGQEGQQGQVGPAGLGAPPSGYPVIARNALNNPGGELAQGWLSNNATTWPATWDTSVKRSGAQSRKSVWNPASAPNQTVLSLYSVGATALNAAGQPAIGPLEYVFAMVFLRANRAGFNGRIEIAFRNAANSQVGSAVSITPLAGADTWTPVVVRAQAPANTAYLYVTAYVQRSDATAVLETDIGWADDAMVIVGGAAPALDHFDGNTPGARWTGTPGASPSELITPRRSDLVSIGSELDLHGIGSPVGVVSAPIGVYYTDDARTNGAWRWFSTAAGTGGWIVVEGDTGWRDVTTVWGSNFDATNTGKLYVRRTAEGLYWRAIGLLLTQGNGAMQIAQNLTPHWRAATFSGVRWNRSNNADASQDLVAYSSVLRWQREVNLATVTTTRPSAPVQGDSGPIPPALVANQPWPVGDLPGLAS